MSDTLGWKRMYIALVVTTAAMTWLDVSTATAQSPEIAHVHPDFMGAHDHLRQSPALRSNAIRHVPQIITGENFDSDTLEIWVWAPPGNDDDAFLESALAQREGDEGPALPLEPPDDARQVQPIDVDGQVIVAVLSHTQQRRAVLWLRNEQGFSAPYLFNVAQPLWVNHEQFEPGALMRIFGYGLRREYRENRLALKRGQEVILLNDYGRRPGRPSRNPFYISYETRLLETHLPNDVEPGAYEVYVHNGWGGEFGWRKAGELRVVAPVDDQEQIFDVRRDFDAVGDGRANDTEPLREAMAAAAEADGKAVVYFPPGTYMVDESLRVPSGVTLRGAGPHESIIEGFGFTPGAEGGRNVADWYSPQPAPYSVILLEPRTGLEELAIKGSVAQGGGGSGQVEAVDGDEAFPGGAAKGHLTLRRVHLHSPIFDAEHGIPGARFYSDAFRAGGSWRDPVYRVKVTDSVLHGDLRLGGATRADLIGNTIHGGAIQSGRMFDSFVDANVMQDDPYRLYSYRPVWNTYYRSNEIRNFGNRRVHGASEPLMLHGGGGKVGGNSTDATADTLTDANQQWEPHHYRDRDRGFMVMITAGRGFGQYRRVIDNTENTLIVEEPWRIVPDQTSEYALGGFFVNTVFYDNFNSGLGRLTLWLDCINVVVEHHRDHLAGGIDIWGSDRSNDERPGRFSPSWYNMILANEMEASRIYIHDNQASDNLWSGPTLFGNYIVGNNIVRPLHRNVRQNAYPVPAINTGVDAYQNRAEPLERDTARNTYTMVINNTIARSAVGIRVPEGVRKHFVLRNEFIDVSHPIIDHGLDTVIGEANQSRRIDPETGHVTQQPAARDDARDSAQ